MKQLKRRMGSPGWRLFQRNGKWIGVHTWKSRLSPNGLAESRWVFGRDHAEAVKKFNDWRERVEGGAGQERTDFDGGAS